MHRAAAIAVVLAACGGPPPPSTVGNRAAVEPPRATCPTDAGPFEPPPPSDPGDQCVHGEAAPLLVAAAAAPTCHYYRVTGPTSAVEAVTLPDGRRVWLRQGGCVHATIEVRGRAAQGVTGRSRIDAVNAAAALLIALDTHHADFALQGLARDLAAAAPAAPVGTFPLGAGDWTAEVEVGADDALTVTLDFPL